MRLDTAVAFGLFLAASCSDHPSASAPDPAPPDVVKSALANDEFLWDSVSARDYTLYVPRGSYAASRLAEFGAATQEAIARDLSMLGDTTLPGHLRVFYVSSRAEMKTIAGGAYSGKSDAAALGVVLVAANGWRPAHRHEIMHVLSLRAWGYPGTNAWTDPAPTPAIWRQGAWLREGLAAAAEQLCGAYTYRGFAAQMQTEGQLFPLDTLRDAFDRPDDLATYVQAGSLVQYLLQRFGEPRFRELWRDAGRDVQRIYGESAASIESDWHALLRMTSDPRPPSVAALRSQGCAPPRR
jgi:hypothetical protein